MEKRFWPKTVEPITSAEQADYRIRKRALRSRLSTLALGVVAAASGYLSYRYFNVALKQETDGLESTPLDISFVLAAFGVVGSTFLAHAERAHAKAEMHAVAESYARFSNCTEEHIRGVPQESQETLLTKVDTAAYSNVMGREATGVIELRDAALAQVNEARLGSTQTSS